MPIKLYLSTHTKCHRSKGNKFWKLAGYNYTCEMLM